MTDLPDRFDIEFDSFCLLVTPNLHDACLLGDYWLIRHCIRQGVCMLSTCQRHDSSHAEAVQTILLCISTTLAMDVM